MTFPNPDLEALRRLGLDEHFLNQCDSDTLPRLGRVLTEQRGRYLVASATERRDAVISGAFRHRFPEPLAFPAVGDWVVLDAARGGDVARIERVLERSTLFVRRSAGGDAKPQAIAANVTTVFVVTAASASTDRRVQRRGVNPRRIERYLVAVRQSGAIPVLVVNKCDLLHERDAVVESLRPLTRDVPVLFASAATGEGIPELAAWVAGRDTVALVGSSGVGKSALIARLLGAGFERTGETRDDDERGRHTTTARELFVLPGGGTLIDTPGMRELGLWWESAEIDEVFEEVADLAVFCRFRDCRHAGEPGCAVRSALESGELDPERLESRHKLERELAFERRRVDPSARRAAKRVLVQRARAFRKKLSHDP